MTVLAAVSVSMAVISGDGVMQVVYTDPKGLQQLSAACWLVRTVRKYPPRCERIHRK